MRARTNAGVIAIPPIEKIVAAFRTGTRMIGNFVGGPASRVRHFLREFVEGSGAVIVGNRECTGPRQCGKWRRWLNRELIQRQMFRAEVEGFLQFGAPLLWRLMRPRVDQIE